MNKNKKTIIILLMLALIMLATLGIALWIQYSNKKRHVTYDGYIYKLPANCQYRENYQEQGIQKLNIYHVGKTNWFAVIRAIEKETFLIDDSLFFDDPSQMLEYIQDEGLDVKNGETRKHNNIKYITFEYDYENIKSLLAYIPAYDDKVFAIHLTSGIVNDGNEEYILNYEALNTVIDILKKGKKIE